MWARDQTLFEMSTTEGWTQVMYNGMDATGRDTAMRRDNQRLYAIFFLVFMVMGNFFLLNLFVGIILDNFTRQVTTRSTHVPAPRAYQQGLYWRRTRAGLPHFQINRVGTNADIPSKGLMIIHIRAVTKTAAVKRCVGGTPLAFPQRRARRRFRGQAQRPTWRACAEMRQPRLYVVGALI